MTLQQRIDRALWPYLCRGWLYAVLVVLLAVAPILLASCAAPDLSRAGFYGHLAFQFVSLSGALIAVNSRARYLEWKYRSRGRSS